MINSHRTGAFISRLRKDKDWTQLELAEKLHVTHQAVSRWETGETFPDIATLPDIARLFNCTVDDLLAGEQVQRVQDRPSAGTVVEELAAGRTVEAARIAREDPGGLDAVLEAAPLARPSAMNEIARTLSGVTFTAAQAAELAPFVDSEVLGSLIADMPLEDLDEDVLSELAPFLSADDLDRIVQHVLSGKLSFEAVGALAPFLRQDTLDRLVQEAEISGNIEEALPELAPFLSRAALDRLVERAELGEISVSTVGELAPFLSQEAVSRLFERAAKGDLSGVDLSELAPFLDQSTLYQALARIDQLDAQTVIELAPFLDKDMLADLIRKGLKR